MEKISLDIKKTYRNVEVNGKTIQIPKMNLKHQSIISTASNLESGFKDILKSIHPNLSAAERDLVTLHVLAYNGKIKEKVMIDDIEYSIFDVKITQQLKFNIDDYEFKFKTPKALSEATIDQILNENCVSVKKDGIAQPIPDFLDLPAFVHEWVELICDSISLNTHNKHIKGLYNIVGVFDG